MDTTLIIAIVGAVTGIFALILQYTYYRHYSPKLIFQPLENSYIIKNSEIPLDYPKISRYVVLSYRISNSSAHPITISTVYAKQKYKKDKWTPHIDFEVPKFKVTKNSDSKIRVNPTISALYSCNDESMLSLDIQKPAVLPLRIEAYDTTLVSFTFPFFDILAKPIILKIETPRKTYKFKPHPRLLQEGLDEWGLKLE